MLMSPPVSMSLTSANYQNPPFVLSNTNHHSKAGWSRKKAKLIRIKFNSNCWSQHFNGYWLCSNSALAALRPVLVMFWLVNAKLMMGWSEELTTNIYTDLDSGLLGLGVYCLLPVICLILLFWKLVHLLGQYPAISSIVTPFSGQISPIDLD